MSASVGGVSALDDEACWPESAVDRPHIQVGDHRPHDRLGRLVPRNPFDGLTLAHAIPGFLGLWSKPVPPEHVIHTLDHLGRSKRLVWCSCGMTTPLASCGPTGCVGVFRRDDGEELDYAGPCTRFFLATSRDVRVRRFEGIAPSMFDAA